MKALRRASVLLVLAALGVAGAATPVHAQEASSVAPPGNSAVDQYRESLPPSSGERRSLSEKERQELRRRGTDGQALDAVLERSGGVPRARSEGGRAASGSGSESARPRNGTADRSARDAERPAKRNEAAPAGTVDDAGSRSVAPAAASSTVGPVPVWAMIVAAAVLVGIALIVRRRQTS